MGWKGTLRSVNASIKAAQRETARRNREFEKQLKIDEKNRELRNAQAEYEEYALYCHLIVSLHHECSGAIDWKELVQKKEPNKPKRLKVHENKAKDTLDMYKPGLIDKLFKLQKKRINALEDKIVTASKKDDQIYDEKVDIWKNRRDEWVKETGLAKQLLDNDSDAKIKIIEYYDPFSSISQIGSEIKFSINKDSLLTVTVNVHGKEIIPCEIKTLLKSGKLSTKKMPKGQYNELFQDYVCSVVLRVANEVFSLLPDDLILINAVDEMLNPKTGHQEETLILSIVVSRNTLSQLNMSKLDPSDSMENFVHRMSFKKLKGFEKVEPLDLCSLSEGM